MATPTMLSGAQRVSGRTRAVVLSSDYEDVRPVLAAAASVWDHATERDRLTFRVALQNATQLQVRRAGMRLPRG